MYFIKKLGKYKFELINKWRLLMFNLFEKPLFKSFGNTTGLGKDYFFLNKNCISIGTNFTALHHSRIEAIVKYYHQTFTPEIIIGNNVCLNSDVHIGCINKVSIGNNVLMASRIFISDHSHGDISAEALKLPPVKRELVSKGPVIIEDDVWIGEGVSILAGVTIGKGSIIGANAVVTQSFEAGSVIAGVPGKLIKKIV